MPDNLILESKFTTHQKIHITLSLGTPFILIIFTLLRMELNYKGYLILFLLIFIYSLMVCLAFTKKGLLKINSDLYRGLFFINKLILKKKIDLTDKPKVSILKFKRSQKMGWFSVARPDLALEFNAFDITLLNNKHTQKEVLISLSNEYLSKKAIDFLQTNFGLKHEIYSPDFS